MSPLRAESHTLCGYECEYGRGKTDGCGRSKGSGSWSIRRWRHALSQRHADRNQVVDSTDRDRWTPPRHRSRHLPVDLARARPRTRHRESTGDCQWPKPAGGEAANTDSHLSQGGRSDVPSQSPALARRQDREELDARHGEAGVPSQSCSVAGEMVAVAGLAWQDGLRECRRQVAFLCPTASLSPKRSKMPRQLPRRRRP